MTASIIGTAASSSEVEAEAFVWLAALAVVGALPLLIAVARRHRRGQVTLVRLLAGWTVVGWLAALALACRPRRWRTPGAAAQPRAVPDRQVGLGAAGGPLGPWLTWSPEALPVPAGLYVDGVYLISSHDGACTWAIHDHGQWAISYQIGEEFPVSGWVRDAAIPVDVRALALAPTQSPRRSGHD